MWNSSRIIAMRRRTIVTFWIFWSLLVTCKPIHGQDHQEQAEAIVQIDPTTGTSDDAGPHYDRPQPPQAEMHHGGDGISNSDHVDEGAPAAYDENDYDDDAETDTVQRQLAAARRRAESARILRERRRNMVQATIASSATSTTAAASAAAADAARRQVESAAAHHNAAAAASKQQQRQGGRRNKAIQMTTTGASWNKDIDSSRMKGNDNLETAVDTESADLTNEGQEEIQNLQQQQQQDSSATADSTQTYEEEEQEISEDDQEAVEEEETAADTESSSHSTDDDGVEKQQEIDNEEWNDEAAAATNSESVNDDEVKEGQPLVDTQDHRVHLEQPTLINGDKDEGDYDGDVVGDYDDDDDDDDMEKYLADFDILLNEHDASMDMLLSSNRAKMEKQEQLLATLTADYSHLEQLTATAVQQIQRVNVRQLEELRNALKRVYNDEVARRQRIIMKTAATTTTVDSIPEIMTAEELEPHLSETLAVLKRRDEQVEKIITNIIMEKASNGLDIPDFAQLEIHDGDEGEEYEVGPFSSVGKCVTPAEAVETIHQTLVNFSNDFIGRQDHVVTDFAMLSSSLSRVGDGYRNSIPPRRHGGRIVHEMTSATYIADRSQQEQSQTAALGESWWRQFIPEDWEAFLLPVGWEAWDTRIPLWLAHTLRLGGGGVFGAAAAPPETILQTQTLPGACWPMDGATGHVTVALPYTLFVDGISIDHASRTLLEKRDEQAKSAPKRVRLIGYPPCSDDGDNEDGEDDDDNSSCRGLSFNPHDPLHIMDLEYDIHKTTTQTFDVKLDGIDIDQTSCAADEEEGSCSARPAFAANPLEKDDVIAAVRFEVLENWGNPDYTCLYRVRVHGKRAEAEG